jgi:CBS domain-containing protein
MKASDIMTKDVVTVRPDTTVREIAALMTERRISGVPVVDAGGKLVGIVSESDLLHRTETGTERRRKWWLGVFQDADSLAREYAKAHGHKARDIMSTSLVSVEADTELGEVAELLDKRNLKRVPVTLGGTLAGIITRGDLVRALAQATSFKGSSAARDDVVVRRAIEVRMREATWLNESLVSVDVIDGVAKLTGMIPSEDQRRALRILVEETPGVDRAEDNLRIGRISMSA